MLSLFYQYHVIEHRFKPRLICFFVVSSNDQFFKLRSFRGRFKATVTVKGLIWCYILFQPYKPELAQDILPEGIPQPPSHSEALHLNVELIQKNRKINYLLIPVKEEKKRKKKGFF